MPRMRREATAINQIERFAIKIREIRTRIETVENQQLPVFRMLFFFFLIFLTSFPLEQSRVSLWPISNMIFNDKFTRLISTTKYANVSGTRREK